MNSADMVETVLEIFEPSLFERSVIDTHLIGQIRQHGQGAAFELAALLGNSWGWMVEFKLFAFCLALAGGLLVGLQVLMLGKRLERCLQPRLAGEGMAASQLVAAQWALIWAVIPPFSLFLGFIITKFFFYYSKIASFPLMELYQGVALSLVMMVLVIAASKALCRLSISALAPITMPVNTVWRLVLVAVILLALVALDDVVATALTALGFPSDFITALHLPVVLLVFLGTCGLLYKRRGMSFISFCVLLVVITAFFVALAGYVHLSFFIIKFLSVFVAFLPLIALVLIITRALMAEAGFAATLHGRCLAQRFSLSAVRLDQIGLVIGLGIGTMLLATIALLILALSGFSAAHIGAAALHLLTGIEIGAIFISPLSLLVGFIFFLLSLGLWRWLSKTIDGVVLARGHIDSGVRHSIRTVSGYVGLGLAVIIGASAAGFNLSSLALIAGGLSLGIGFGMQNIVQNFVSGLILLAERPFKVGDFIEAGSVTGTVRRISVRATTIETLQQRIVTMPNSAFINGNVSNWTPRDASGQIEMSFTLPARTTAEVTFAALRDLVLTDDQVLHDPAPEGELVAFDDKNFTFTLYLHIADIKTAYRVKDALRRAVYQHFFAREEQADAP